MDFSFSPEDEAFRQEVRTWIKENIPGNWGSEAWPIPEDEADLDRDVVAWGKKLYEGRWAGITWPEQYGGRGATPIQQFIFQEEMSAFRVPPTYSSIGIGMAGPTIMTWGVQDQKDAHLKKILSGEEIFCQGFS